MHVLFDPKDSAVHGAKGQQTKLVAQLEDISKKVKEFQKNSQMSVEKFLHWMEMR